MKTPIDIAESLLTRAKQVAATDGTTLRKLVEDGLRRVLQDRDQRASFRLRRATFRGMGLQPAVAAESWQRRQDLAYEGRGTYQIQNTGSRTFGRGDNDDLYYLPNRSDECR